MALKFSRLNNDSSPKRDYDGQEDQSYGFIDAFKLQTGNTRGTQTVGYGGAKIDGANNRIVITNPATGKQIGMGSIPGSTTDEFGFFSIDDKGVTVLKIIDAAISVFNPKDSYHNSAQFGILPDGTGGWATASPGYDIADGIE